MNRMNAQPDSLRPLALLATGRSGADIERLVREVRRKTRREQRALTWADLDAALRAHNVAMSKELRRQAAIHEAGHALVYSLTGIAEVQSASIGLNGIGVVRTIPNGHLPQTETWLMNSIAALLAGRAAELLIFGETVAGNGGVEESDLARATLMALAAETSLGFSLYQPLVYRSVPSGIHQLIVDRELAERVNQRLEHAEMTARQMIVDNQSAFDRIAGRLEAVGIMEGDDVRQILADRGG